MSNLWVDIETLVLDGVPLNAAQGRRVAQLTDLALARLLDQRGTVSRIASLESNEKADRNTKSATMRVPANANEARWAEELALTLYRAMDRTL
jgi:hypothetical protein